jgi:uncharacterized protein (TIGR02611 family)
MAIRDADLILGRMAQFRRIAAIVSGIALLVVGAALLVLPGPGIPLIIAGLALLAAHFHWARRAHEWTRARFREAAAKLTGHGEAR